MSPCTDHGVLPNGERADENGPGTNARSSLDMDPLQLEFSLGAWVFVVCKNHIRPNENAIFNGRPVVDTHTVLHRDLIADLNIVLNEYVGADVAGISDHGLFEYHNELPYAVAHSNVFRLHIGQGNEMGVFFIQ